MIIFKVSSSNKVLWELRKHRSIWARGIIEGFKEEMGI